MGLNGILLIDKPQDWTSSDVVAKLRGILHERRIGHSGTLDPLATGLLVVFIGRATRAVEFAEADSKEYIASLRLGVKTDTQDITGNVLSESECDISEDKLNEALSHFVGDIEQIPPMYSAIKVGGKKLYELARRGEEIERKARKINISKLEIISHDGDYVLNVACSKGTYIRTLCNDIGDYLACGGCMSQLRRVKAGVFDIENAHTLAEVQAAADSGTTDMLVIPVDTLFCAYPEIIASANEEKKLRCGNIINISAENGTYRVYSETGEFLLLGEVSDGKLKTIKSFFEV